mmetsp:Transcript_174413/g.559099  ORF Transcript_174413/g.559099 Transcript_174413/m.559099 type:complete len:232 (-) Transcript_174413:14-709(-)
MCSVETSWIDHCLIATICLSTFQSVHKRQKGSSSCSCFAHRLVTASFPVCRVNTRCCRRLLLPPFEPSLQRETLTFRQQLRNGLTPLCSAESREQPIQLAVKSIPVGDINCLAILGRLLPVAALRRPRAGLVQIGCLGRRRTWFAHASSKRFGRYGFTLSGCGGQVLEGGDHFLELGCAAAFVWVNLQGPPQVSGPQISERSTICDTEQGVAIDELSRLDCDAWHGIRDED